MKDLGYENHNIIQILGSIGIILFINFMMNIIYVIFFSPVNEIFPKSKWRITRYLRKTLHYS